jgi:hypothetical protein
MLPEGNQIAESVYEAKKIICPLEIMQTLTSPPSVAMIGTRGKRVVEMIIMLMTRTSPVRSEVRRRRLTEGLL